MFLETKKKNNKITLFQIYLPFLCSPKLFWKKYQANVFVSSLLWIQVLTRFRSGLADYDCWFVDFNVILVVFLIFNTCQPEKRNLP